jgi:hypothetical protein
MSSMPQLGGALSVSIALLAATLGGCTEMRRLSDEPPAGVSLAGNWQLDPKLSTDSRAALRQLVPSNRKKSRSSASSGGTSPDSGQTVDTGEQGPPSGARGRAAAQQFGPDLNFPPDISLQQSLLAGGDYLKIEQQESELVIWNGETTRSFVPGEKSVVSVPSGVADQRSGWKGKEYWIEIRPQVGPHVTEKLHLSDKGDQLIETIEVGSEGRVRPLHVTRVYTPTREIPAAVPGEN